MPETEPPKEDVFKEKREDAQFIWDEYKYRHGHIWRLIFQMTTALVAISIIPYILPDKAEDKVGVFIIVLPFIGVVLSIICTSRISRECELLDEIRKKHREFHENSYTITYKDKSSSFTRDVKVYFYSLILLALLNFGKVAYNLGAECNMNTRNNRFTFFHELYQNFNTRNIELVISKMTDNVKWANGMEGGYVYGHNGVRDYWTRQFKVLSPNVTPMTIKEENGFVKIKVHQIVHDLEGKLLSDEYVYHHFRLQGDKIAEFNIGEKIKD